MRGEDKSVIEKEMEKISECGIRSVCVEARPHDQFCREGWWKDLGVVIGEAKNRGMKVWILDDKHFPTGYANGLIEEKYPERKKTYIYSSKADIYGGERYVTLNVVRMLKPSIGYWEIGKPFNIEERKNNSLLAVIAVRCAEGMELHEETIDLTDKFDGTNISFKIPAGAWRVHVIYKTMTDGGNESYINPIDKISAHTQIEAVYEPHYEHFKDEFGKTIAGFFSDEPQFGNISEMCYDTRLGKKRMPLPWSDELQEMLEEKYGKKYAELLPFLFERSEEQKLGAQIRYDYMDCVSRLYKKNFSDAIGNWCRNHGVEYIGHVVEDNGLHSRFGMGAAHYFRAMSGQDMAGIDCIGGQVIYGGANQGRLGIGESGGDGEFYHYALGKLGASCGHLDPKKKGRVMCELFGAYGWNFGVRDMKYVLDHLLVKGVNYLVPHAFSMAEYPDHDCPPHFYAGGHNPEFPYFTELMKYADRMCKILSGGQHVSSAAVLYDAEADWTGENMPMQKVCRELIEHQIDFDIVSIDMLSSLDSYNGKCENGRLIINGVEFKALVIPYTSHIPEALYRFLEHAGDLPVIFADALPNYVINLSGEPKKLADCESVPLNNISEMLRKKNIFDIELSESFPELSFYHYVKDGKSVFVFLNESADKRFSGAVKLPVKSDTCYYDSFLDKYEKTEYNEFGVKIELEPAECVVLMEKESSAEITHKSFAKQIGGMKALDISESWKVSKVSATDYPKFPESEKITVLKPISESYPAFSGVIRYEKKFDLDEKPSEAYFRAENIYKVMSVYVNGKKAGFRIAPPYQLPIGEYLEAGENTITVEVATTPARDQLNFPQPPFDFQYDPIDATGMFGKISILTK